MIEVPRDIRTGEKLISAQAWERMSEMERAICAYHNSPHKQRTAEMYRAIKEAGDDDG